LLEILKLSGKKASELASCMESYPQVLVNLKITADKKGLWDKNATVMDCIHKHEATLGDTGRVLVRESGTEPLIRVMLEGKNQEQITIMANDIAETIRVSL
jgi:phosphoglucosamine mutase